MIFQVDYLSQFFKIDDRHIASPNINPTPWKLPIDFV